MFEAALTGYSVAFSLILAIGAQNAFVLRQGLLRQHVFAISLFCALSDALLITAGVYGFAAATSLFPDLPRILAIAGALFLFAYGALRFRSAWLGAALETAKKSATSLKSALLACFAFTWLNPHVYLDTLGLIGAVSVAFEGTLKLIFALGAISASFSFFFALGYGARLLSPILSTKTAWKVLDAGIGGLMWVLAFWLIQSA